VAEVTQITKEKIADAKATVHNREKGIEESTKTNQRNKKKKYLMISLALAAFLMASAAIFGYYKVAVYYQVHFFPNTIINGLNCGDLEVEPVIASLDAWIEGYFLEVRGRNYLTGEPGTVLGSIAPSDIQLAFTGTREAVMSALQQQEAYKWLWKRNQEETYFFEQNLVFDEKMLEDTVKAWEACRKENMQKPKDAYISEYSEEDNCYEIIAETIGTELDVDRVIQLVGEAIRQRETALDIDQLGCYQEPAVRKEDTVLTRAVDTVNRWLGTSVTYDWNGSEVILNHEVLKDWISLKDGVPVLDQEAVAQFVKKQAASYDTYGKRRNFKTALGVELTLPSGYYGWKTDKEAETAALIQHIYQGDIIQKEPIYSSTAQKKGMSDIGNSYVEADLTHQHLYLYQNGTLVLETDFVSGDMSSKPGNVTPEGVFGVAYKTTNAILRGDDYESPVSYWMPYYGNYGMHDATWRNEFGGDIYLTNGSHGCINLPLDKAAQIYRSVYAGFPVICYYYQVDPLAGQEPENPAPEENDGEEDDSEDDDDNSEASDDIAEENGNGDEGE